MADYWPLGASMAIFTAVRGGPIEAFAHETGYVLQSKAATCDMFSLCFLEAEGNEEMRRKNICL